METTINLEYSRRLPRRDQASKAKIWAGRAMTAFPLLFLALDGVMKFTNVPEVVEGSEKIGFHKATLPYLGGIELLATLLVAVPRTRVFGAVLISAYLGGAVATHVRLGEGTVEGRSHLMV